MKCSRKLQPRKEVADLATVRGKGGLLPNNTSEAKPVRNRSKKHQRKHRQPEEVSNFVHLKSATGKLCTQGSFAVANSVAEFNIMLTPEH